MKKATLKQIAEIAGVSMTTVHRALNGKGGCSKEMEQLICQIAEEQGYTTNTTASSSSKPPIQIGLIFPFRDSGGRFSLDRMLDGYLEYRRELKDYNIVYQEFLLRSSDRRPPDYLEQPYPELEATLQQIYAEQPVHFDGLIVFGLSVNRRAEAMIRRIMEKGTKVVIIERVFPSLEGTCSVMPHNEMCGNIAGEILCQNHRGTGTVAVIRNDLPTGDAAADACIRYVRQERPGLRLVELSLPTLIHQDKEIADFLQTQTDLVAVYATSGRHTKSLMDAMHLLALRDMTAIGTELFDESRLALNDKVLSAVIDKQPAKVGFAALHILIRCLIHDEPMPPQHRVPPRIIIHANCDAYYGKREYLYKSDVYND